MRKFLGEIEKNTGGVVHHLISDIRLCSPANSQISTHNLHESATAEPNFVNNLPPLVQPNLVIEPVSVSDAVGGQLVLSRAGQTISMHLLVLNFDVSIVIGAEKPHRNCQTSIFGSVSASWLRNSNLLDPRIMRTTMVHRGIVPVRSRVLPRSWRKSSLVLLEVLSIGSKWTYPSFVDTSLAC